MALTVTYDGVDLTASPYSVMATTAPYRRGPQRTSVNPFALWPRGVRLNRPPGLIVVPLVLRVEGVRTTGAQEAALDTLNKLLSREGRRLVLSMQDTRWVNATWRPTGDPQLMPYDALLPGEFVAEQSYWSAANPSSSVQTGALSTLTNQSFESGTAYGLQLSLTPGGTAPSPLRSLIAMQSGSITATRYTFRNLYTAPAEALTVLQTIAAGNIISFDPINQIVYDSAMTNVIGYYPLADASGSLIDFSTNSRDMTAAGSPVYNRDGPEFGSIDFDGSAAAFASSSASFALTANITICCWVYADAINPANARGFFGKGATTGNGGFALWMGTDNKFRFGVGSGAATRIAVGGTSVRANRWYHVAGVWVDSTDTATLYVDGELEASTTGGAFTVGGYSGDLRLGAAIPVDDTTLRYWDGRVGGSCAVLNTNLTQTQVRLIRRFGLAAYNGTQRAAVGQWLTMHGENDAATDSVEVRITTASTVPTVRVALGWQSAYDV